MYVTISRPYLLRIRTRSASVSTEAAYLNLITLLSE